MKLEALKNTTRPFVKRKLLGRGPGCKKGKTCGRGVKGMGSRSGYKARHGAEGGGVPLYRRVPTRGFSNARFATCYSIVNLDQIEKHYKDGETVSAETLYEKGIIGSLCHGVKILGKGEISKKVKLQVEAISGGAQEKLQKAGISQ